MSDIDFDDENQSDCDFDDWEDAEEEKELEKEKEEQKLREEEERKAEIARKKQEKWERIEAAKGNVEEDAIEEIDGVGEKEYKDMIARHEVEVTYGEVSNKFESKPIANMEPSTKEEYQVMGDKLGNCVKTFRSSKFYFYILNSLVTKSSDKLCLEECQELSKKLNVIHAERTKAMKDGVKKEKKDKYEKVGEAEEETGRPVQPSGEGRNDFKDDGKDLGDFM
eukprot:TRINITY_DN1610_c1_g2_i1.p1 TRINITY_DN1610_c1_g2~~TRINITY_DN1610_c1_g2_i1.p1  ORF type:complete len:223 (-),score=74.52 TRINITY_DN1610_c1_g2_i1:84-752(-)